VAAARQAIQFIQGMDEQTIPDVRLTKSRDSTNGVAIFTFEQPSVFDSSAELGAITGFYMIDDEGVLQSVDVSAKFVNGKPPREWEPIPQLAHGRTVNSRSDSDPIRFICCPSNAKSKQTSR
jgi:photosystem II reaction center protein Psb28